LVQLVSSRTALVGRTAELSDLRGGIRATLACRSQFFLLTGEPGIGKTRLAAEAAHEARARGMRVTWSACGDEIGAPPYWPFIQIWRDLKELVESGTLALKSFPGIDFEEDADAVAEESNPANKPESGRFALFDAVATLLAKASRIQPLMLTLDDFHEADEASWVLLRFLARKLSKERVMMVVSARIHQGSFTSNAICADLIRIGNQIALPGLSEGEVLQIASNYSGRAMTRRFATKLHRVTGGNPFFVTEVIRNMLARDDLNSSEFPMPDSVRVSIRARLEKLPTRIVSTLSAAAVVGAQFDLGLLKKVLGRPLDEVRAALDAALREGILVAVADSTVRFAFSHALLREVLYNDLGSTERARLHRKVAKILEAVYQSDPQGHLDELAYHFGRAANSERTTAKAVDYACAAAEAARKVHAYERAANHWQSVLELMERAGYKPRRIAEVLFQLGDAYSITEFEQPKGIRCLERAALIFDQVGATVESAHAQARLGMILSRRGPSMNIPGAMAAYRQAEQVLSSLPPSDSLALLYIGLAQAAAHAEKTMEGDVASLKGMEIARGLGNESLWLLAAAQQSDFLFSRGKIAESMRLSECAWQSADRMNDLTGAFETAWSGGYHPLGLWDPRDARRWFARELSRPRQNEAASQRAILTQQTAFANLMLGQLQVAGDLMAEAPRDVVEGLRQFYAGDWMAADRMLDEACDMMLAVGSRDGETVACFFRAQVQLAMGNLDHAESLNERVVRNSVEGPIVPYELNSRAQAALIAVFRNDLLRAREHIHRCRQIVASGEDFRGLLGRAALAEAAVAGADGDRERSSAMFADVIKTFRRFGLVWEEAEARFTWANVLLRVHDRERALEQFSLAQSLYERYGAGKVWTERIESTYRLAGLTRRWPHDGRRSASPDMRASDEHLNVIRCEGDYFTLIYCGRVLRLRSSKGLNYIAQLLARPFASLAPEALIRAQLNGRGSLGIAVASAAGPHSRERARIAVTKAIKSTVEKIRGADPALGRLLGVAIRTGYSCTYQPDPDNHVCWNVEGMRLAADNNGHPHAAS